MDTDIDEMLERTLSQCVDELTTVFPLFHQFPDAAQLALIDMVFTLGIDNMQRNYTGLCTSVLAHKWAKAATQCLRPTVSEPRNLWTKEQFIHAAE